MARKRREGVAVADAVHKTVAVRVERTVMHPLYRKVQRRRKRYLAHDEGNTCRNGDRVLIEECRPISKRKSWRVVEILERREVAEVQPTEIGAPVIETPEAPPEPAAAESEVPAAAGGAETAEAPVPPDQQATAEAEPAEVAAEEPAVSTEPVDAPIETEAAVAPAATAPDAGEAPAVEAPGGDADDGGAAESGGERA